MSKEGLQPTGETYRPAPERLFTWLTRNQGKSPRDASTLISRIEVFQFHASGVLDSQTSLWVVGKAQTESEPTTLQLHLLWPEDVISEERKNYGMNRLNADFGTLVASNPPSPSDIVRELDFIDEVPHDPELEYLGCFGLTPEEARAAELAFNVLGEHRIFS